MNELLWNIATLLIWAFFPVSARVLLQWAMDRDMEVQWLKGLALFLGSLAAAIVAGMLCGLSPKTSGMKEAATSAMGFFAQDVAIVLIAGARHYRKRPMELIRELLARTRTGTKQRPKNDPDS